ncbi:MAG: leucine-rich repeat protein, partial [Anaeroplasmataceae bacterium]|nr:leucine-rich repeat protein [Anaeroplasmataceae bacterium]
AEAFQGCLSSMKLNALYLQEIEENAFQGCINLTEVYLTRIKSIGAYAFANCSSLENVTIESINEIGTYAFNGCTNLKTITLPACVESIGQKSLGFVEEELITDFVIIGDANTLAKTYALTNGIVFKTVFEDIKGFYYDTYFNEETGNEEIVITLVDTQTTGNIIIPESYKGMIVSKIGDEAFASCLVTGVILPETITQIGTKAFNACQFLESINLDNIVSIGISAFYECSSLKYVNMPLVEELPRGAFSSCSSLKFIDLSGVTAIGQDAFNECYELEKVICPNLVTLDAAFKETTSLKSVDTKNVKTITGNAFIYSKSLEELYFPKLETISSGGLFSGCPSLKKVVIGENFESYAIDIALDLIDWSYYNVPIYGYKGSVAEEWALRCVNYNNTKHWDFIAIDEIDELKITKDLSNQVEPEYNSSLYLSVEAEGIGLTYQWYKTEGDISLGVPIKDATENQLKVDTTLSGNNKYYVLVSDWKGDVVASQVCEVTITNSNSKSISVTLGEHLSSQQNGEHQVNEGEDFQITFIADAGYHISSIVVDGVSLSQEELQTALSEGYKFRNVSSNHTIVISSAPNTNTEYKVYHYKQSLEVTTYEFNGRYYELEEETLTGTTDTLTVAAERTYEGFTAEDFEQKNINGNGDTIVSIRYNRNSYTVTLVTCEGVTVEGAGTYLYGETVVVKANVEEGYVWVEWQSSNPDELPSEATMEYTFNMPSLNIELIAIVNILQPDQVNIKVKTEDHIISSQTGNHQITKGETFKVTFTIEVGYHISSIVVDEVAISTEELEAALIHGYEFTNISENHTIEIISAPNNDTEYKVCHYKQSLETTPYEIDGKYYELEEETLTGTTGELTSAIIRSYEGFTAEDFEQKNINGSGDTIVSIRYNRNSYTVTLVTCEGVTVEGAGTYLYGEKVVIKAKVDTGYVWVEWRSSNPVELPNKNSIEYSFEMPSQNITLTACANELQSSSKYIEVIIGNHITSLQSGNNQVNIGDTFKVTFSTETGYHISRVIIDGTELSSEEMNNAIRNGYLFNNITNNHNIKIISAPNDDTEYKVYHYKQSLKETLYKINGKYYELEEETKIGTTGELTAAVERKYEGFTSEVFNQKIIKGNGNT